jgi:transcriptional regulator with XRE-family HTH domain
MKYKEFAERFKACLEEASPPLPVKDGDIAKEFGVKQPMISYWRYGQKLPSMETAQIIAKRCGVCVEWLLTGRGPKYPGIPDKQVSRAANQIMQAIPELADNQVEILADMAQALLGAGRKAGS